MRQISIHSIIANSGFLGRDDFQDLSTRGSSLHSERHTGELCGQRLSGVNNFNRDGGDEGDNWVGIYLSQESVGE
jgi:hypothetical protein